jgi:general secretion pathway protein G
MEAHMQAGRAHRNLLSSGFTLTELLVVMVIVGVLVSLVAPMVYQHVAPAKHTAARGQMKSFMTALDNFYLDVGRFPKSKEGLEVLRKPPAYGSRGWNGPYMRRDIPSDPWGYAYIYRTPGENGPYDIVSFGADGKAGGEGEAADVFSWQVE